ncbi:MAG: hypothetical protein ACKO96_21380, partial [Flammeovirgaceae bacterium]
MSTESQMSVKPADRIKEVEEYYFSRKLAEVRGLDSPEWRVINLGIGSPDQAPAQSAFVILITMIARIIRRSNQCINGTLRGCL